MRARGQRKGREAGGQERQRQKRGRFRDTLPRRREGRCTRRGGQTGARRHAQGGRARERETQRDGKRQTDRGQGMASDPRRTHWHRPSHTAERGRAQEAASPREGASALGRAGPGWTRCPGAGNHPWGPQDFLGAEVSKVPSGWAPEGETQPPAPGQRVSVGECVCGRRWGRVDWGAGWTPTMKGGGCGGRGFGSLCGPLAVCLSLSASFSVSLTCGFRLLTCLGCGGVSVFAVGGVWGREGVCVRVCVCVCVCCARAPAGDPEVGRQDASGGGALAGAAAPAQNCLRPAQGAPDRDPRAPAPAVPLVSWKPTAEGLAGRAEAPQVCSGSRGPGHPT